MTQQRSTARRIIVTIGFLAAFIPSLSHTQEAAAKKPSAIVSINPLGLPFKYVAGESESRMTNMLTIGSSVSWLSTNDGSYFSVEAKLRVYPNEEAFKGFSIGVGAGLTRLHQNNDGVVNIDGTPALPKTGVHPTIAVIADYNWLLGKNKRFLVGTGVGAKRIFGSTKGFNDLYHAYPTARFQLGVLF